MYFDGSSCVLKDIFGNELARPSFVGAPVMENGECEISLSSDAGEGSVRARLTLITAGEVLSVERV